MLSYIANLKTRFFWWYFDTKHFWGYINRCNRRAIRRAERLSTAERIRLWEEADAFAKKLDGTKFEIVAIRRNKTNRWARCTFRNLSFPDVEFTLNIKLYDMHTELIDLDGDVGWTLTAKYGKLLYEESGYSWPQYYRAEGPIWLRNLLTLKLERDHVRVAHDELKRDLGSMPDVTPIAELDLVQRGKITWFPFARVSSPLASLDLCD